MKSDIILAGVGGQGILSIASAIGHAAIISKLNLKQAEVHGMSQRGGAVQSHLRLSAKPIASDLISYNSADLILSVEPMECLRYLPYLSPKGWVVTNSVPFINIDNYPEISALMTEIEKLPQFVILNADELAEQAGSARATNMVMLGAASPFINIPMENFEKGIEEQFAKKGDNIISINLKAFHLGREKAMLKK